MRTTPHPLPRIPSPPLPSPPSLPPYPQSPSRCSIPATIQILVLVRSSILLISQRIGRFPGFFDFARQPCHAGLRQNTRPLQSLLLVPAVLLTSSLNRSLIWRFKIFPVSPRSSFSRCTKISAVPFRRCSMENGRFVHPPKCTHPHTKQSEREVSKSAPHIR